MAQKPRTLRPSLSMVHALGAQLRQWRLERGLSQQVLGRLIHVSGDLIGKVEKGERRASSDLIHRCDSVLGCDGALVEQWTVAEAQGHSRRSTPSTAERAIVLAHLPALRRVLDAYDLPDDGPIPSVESVRNDVGRLVRMRLASQYVSLAERLPDALSAHLRAYHAATGQRRTELAGLLIQAFRAADAVVDKFALFDLSARIIAVMQVLAAESCDESLSAAAAYVRGEVFFASGDWITGRRVLTRAAEAISVSANLETTAGYGALHMRAAVLAARAGRSDLAQGHIAEADDSARRVPEGVYAGTAFGPASVRIHEVSLALDVGDPAGALRLAHSWEPPLAVPAERRSHFFVDLADAQARCEKYDDAMATLRVARQVAPQHVRYHPHVKETLYALKRQLPSMPSQLRELVRWTGIETEFTA